ncbi:HCP-like protein [Aulographum hederae CBS 113979]|uniref:HCP-like protein n=1 Tax=Aulographum hederae CBS 113979 TaxID=1176131 RepID=A0A6G1H8T7_9PEZI|nr:HCP-like protein [Aulographum hederae CBS 113979]
MPLKDLLKKKEKVENVPAQDPPATAAAPAPEFTFLRSTTTTQEVIEPPNHPDDVTTPSFKSQNLEVSKRQSRFRRSSNASQTQGLPTPESRNSSINTAGSVSPDNRSSKHKSDRRLSHRLHLTSRSRTASSTSVNLPSDLPELDAVESKEDDEKEAQWEQRATLLAKSNVVPRPDSAGGDDGYKSSDGKRPRARSRTVSDAPGDANIQEAIRLHEEGELARSTEMFGTLADPNGANNALSQVLYGLALRHGWGCTPNPTLAITYLSSAASNSAEIESLALAAGMKKGGSAKGELVLAIFELANCFRQGWGADKDPVAAKQYYETAANLGDTDAMNEVGWCYEHGFGCKKDKFKAAKYLRLAEEKGSKTVGNSWIWKDKYGGPMKAKTKNDETDETPTTTS